jgi:uncharacterized protein (TIGR03083 family)
MSDPLPEPLPEASLSEPSDAPSEPAKEILCSNCVAACCKAPMHLWLRKDEVKRHGESMRVDLVVKPRNYRQRMVDENGVEDPYQLPENVGVYKFNVQCGNLKDDNLCGIYHERPTCCRDFEMGSNSCLKARREAGLDDGVPIVEDDNPPPLTGDERLLMQYFPSSRDGNTPVATATQQIVLIDPLGLPEVRNSIRRDAEWIVARLSELDRVGWQRRTRCADWNVGDLGTHLVTNLRLTQSVVTAAIQGRVAAIPPEFVSDRAGTIAALTRATDDVGNALARLLPGAVDRDVPIGGGDALNVQEVVQVLTMEMAVHSLDLADALGESRHLTSEAARAIAHVLPEQLHPGPPPRAETTYVLRSLMFELPFTWRNGTWRCEPGPDPCYIEGDVEAVLLFALGREPFNSSRLATNDVERARAFKRHLRGP